MRSQSNATTVHAVGSTRILGFIWMLPSPPLATSRVHESLSPLHSHCWYFIFHLDYWKTCNRLPPLPILICSPHYSSESPLRHRSKPSRLLRIWPICLSSLVFTAFLAHHPLATLNYFQFSGSRGAIFFHAFTSLLKFHFSPSSPGGLLLSSHTSAQISCSPRTEVFSACSGCLYQCRLHTVLYITPIHVSAEQLYHKPLTDRDVSYLCIPNHSHSNVHIPVTQ